MPIPPHPVFADMPGAFLDAFGVSCEVTISGVPLASPVRAIVRGPSGEVITGSGYGEPGLNGMTPRVSFAVVDVPGLKDGDRMVLGGVTWVVREPLPDGRGMVRCELERG
ncbi:head-tail joining protein [Nitratireductor pacificus]|uniref:head-tail joining protein n=1 Tax=Nitratireductor pacificus TaxID=1231180 RepID=UPI003B75B793